MSGAIPPLPNTPSWRGAQLKTSDRENFIFIFIFTFTFTSALSEVIKMLKLHSLGDAFPVRPP